MKIAHKIWGVSPSYLLGNMGKEEVGILKGYQFMVYSKQ